MNGTCITLYVNALYPQHLLNKPLTNRVSDKRLPFLPQHCFSIVEHLLRVSVCYLFSAWLYTYSTIQQKEKDVTGIQAVPL